MWQASAERILLAMLYGEFAAVLNTQDNRHVLDLLDHNVVLEMDGLSSASDRVLFSEALVLYLYRYRLAQGPRGPTDQRDRAGGGPQPAPGQAAGQSGIGP